MVFSFKGFQMCHSILASRIKLASRSDHLGVVSIKLALSCTYKLPHLFQKKKKKRQFSDCPLKITLSFFLLFFRCPFSNLTIIQSFIIGGCKCFFFFLIF